MWRAGSAAGKAPRHHTPVLVKLEMRAAARVCCLGGRSCGEASGRATWLTPAAPEHTPPARAALPALQSYDASEFDKLAEKYEKLNWRIIR